MKKKQSKASRPVEGALLTTQQAARVIGCTSEWLLAHLDQFEHRRIGRRARFTLAAIQRWAESAGE